MIKYTVTAPDSAFAEVCEQSVREWKFPDGCVGTNINLAHDDCEPDFGYYSVVVEALIKPDQLMELAFTMDALKRKYPFSKFTGVIPMFPYGRQDRVCSPGEAHSLRVVADMVNRMGFDLVITMDPHSNVIEAVVDNIHVVSQIDLFADVKALADWAETTLVAPDMGARKKVEEFARHVGAKRVVCFDKTRELATGKITGMRCLDAVDAGERFLVLDDICDGGRTFEEVAIHLPRGSYKELVVTHGIFSKGLDKVTDLYNHVYTTNSFRQDLESNGDLTVIAL